MYEDAIKSYKENNIELAQRVINRDDDVDRRYEKLLMTLQMLIQKKGPFALKYIQRLLLNI